MTGHLGQPTTLPGPLSEAKRHSRSESSAVCCTSSVVTYLCLSLPGPLGNNVYEGCLNHDERKQAVARAKAARADGVLRARRSRKRLRPGSFRRWVAL